MHHAAPGIVSLGRALGREVPTNKHVHARAVGAEKLVVSALGVRTEALDRPQPAARIGT